MHSRLHVSGMTTTLTMMVCVTALTPLCGQSPNNANRTAVTDKLANSTVLVSIRFQGTQYAAPGIVFAKSGQQALIAAKVTEELRFQISRRTQFDEVPDYSVCLGEGEHRRFVPASCLTTMDRAPLVVVSAQAEKLPPPIEADPDIELTTDMKLVLAGFESDTTIRRPEVFAPVVEKAIVTSVQPERYGAFAVRCVETPSLSMALVATEKGKVVGFTRGMIPSGRARVAGEYLCDTVTTLQQLLEPRLVNLSFGFAAGDTKRVVYELVAVLDDPLGRISSPRIHCQQDEPPRPQDLDEREQRSYRWPGKLPDDGKWKDVLPNAAKLSLIQKPPSAAVVRQLPFLAQYRESATYVAQFETEHPGYQPGYVLFTQFSYTNDHDEVVFVQPYHLEFSPSRLRNNLPGFPGLDGFPIDYPRPEALSDGGYRVTSERTRLDPLEPQEKFVVHTPEPSGKLVAGELMRAGDADALIIDLPRPITRYGLSMPDMPVAFSADGEWLFYLDMENVLRKISTTNFQQHSTLAVVGCTSLACSSAGLLVAANDANVVWVVDPATLKVDHIIPVKGVHSVAASPTTSIGFAVGLVKEEDRSTFAQLVMLDLKEGRALHRIKNNYKSHLFPRIANRTLFSLGIGTPYMSMDGKHLFLAGHKSAKQCVQFRIDGTDLIFERVLAKYPIAIGNRQYAAQHQQNIGIYELADDETATFTLDLAQVAVGFHPKTNLIYQTVLLPDSKKSREIRRYDPQGKLTATYPKPEVAGAGQILCHPNLDQAVLFGHSRIIYVDFQAGRLPKALGRPRAE